jgi:hypothetical protein
MPKRNFSAGQIVMLLRQIEVLMSQGSACRLPMGNLAAFIHIGLGVDAAHGSFLATDKPPRLSQVALHSCIHTPPASLVAQRPFH